MPWAVAHMHHDRNDLISACVQKDPSSIVARSKAYLTGEKQKELNMVPLFGETTGSNSCRVYLLLRLALRFVWE
jgi:hypothetical protein